MSVNSAEQCCQPLKEGTYIVEKYGATYANLNKVSYTWTIHNFSELPNEVRYSLKSPTFSGGKNSEYKWQLEAFPNGNITANSDYLSLYLYLVPGGASEVKARFRLCLLNNEDEEIKVMQSELRKFTVEQPCNNWGWPQFAVKSFLLNTANRLLSSDSLTILCDVSTFEGTTEISDSEQFYMPDCQWRADFNDLFESMQLSDVTLVTRDREFQAHKVILAARSPVFSRMFQQDMLEKKDGRVDITDVDGDVMMEFLRFIYTSKINNLYKIADGLLTAADKYELERLKGLCEKTLCKTLAFDNVASRLILADLHGCDQLKARALNFICHYPQQVFESLGYKSMLTTYPHLVDEAFKAFAAKCKLTDSPNGSSNRDEKS